MNNIKKFGFLGLLWLASCSNRMNGVSGRYDHYDADAYAVSGGFENENDSRSLSPEPSDRALRPLDDRYEGSVDRAERDDDLGSGFSVADYRRAYRQGYRDGSLDGAFYPGLYRPNYGGWGWGIGPGIGWNAPCWSWGGRWNYFSYWNNPWYDPWGPAWGWGGGGWNGWGYGGWNGWGGGWNHIGWGGGWNGWGGNTYIWVHRGAQTWAGPRRDRLNRVHTITPRGNRWTPWGQTASNQRSVRQATYADRGGIQSTNGGQPRTFRERPSLGPNRTTVPAVNETRRPTLTENRYGAHVESPSRTRYEYRAPTTANREPRTTYSAPRSSYSEPRSTYSAPRSSYSAPRSTYSEPRSTYSAPRTSSSAPRSSYSAPRSTYSAPRSTYSAPRSTYSAPRTSSSAPRSTYSAPRSSSSGSSSGSSGSYRSAPSSSGRSGSFSPRR